MDEMKSIMFEIREATPDDIDFLTIADLRAGTGRTGK